MTMQPYSEIVWPSMDWSLMGGRVTARQLEAIPAIGRGLKLIEGTIKQMPLEDVRGDEKLPKPVFMHQPDPTRSRPWWVGRHIEDYLVHGNAVHVITVRHADGWPAAAMWCPAELTYVTEDPDGQLEYWYRGVRLNTADVVHVRRDADPWNTWRGIGVLEQFMTAAGLLVDQSRYERQILNGSAVPSVAVITPNDDPSQEEIDAAKEQWILKFGGPVREPVILPNGTEVKPLAWSPADSQLVEARKLGLTDAANILNLDAWWLGGESGNYNYKSPGPMWLMLIRQTINPILVDFEGVWSPAWLPWGREVQFWRNSVLGDDMETTARWVRMLVAAGLMTKSEGRVWLGFGATVPDELAGLPAAAAIG